MDPSSIACASLSDQPETCLKIKASDGFLASRSNLGWLVLLQACNTSLVVMLDWFLGDIVVLCPSAFPWPLHAQVTQKIMPIIDAVKTLLLGHHNPTWSHSARSLVFLSFGYQYHYQTICQYLPDTINLILGKFDFIGQLKSTKIVNPILRDSILFWLRAKEIEA